MFIVVETKSYKYIKEEEAVFNIKLSLRLAALTGGMWGAGGNGASRRGGRGRSGEDRLGAFLSEEPCVHHAGLLYSMKSVQNK